MPGEGGGGTPPAFREKRELPCTFFWKTGDHYYIKTPHNHNFFPITIFFYENVKKN